MHLPTCVLAPPFTTFSFKASSSRLPSSSSPASMATVRSALSQPSKLQSLGAQPAASPRRTNAATCTACLSTRRCWYRWGRPSLLRRSCSAGLDRYTLIWPAPALRVLSSACKLASRLGVRCVMTSVLTASMAPVDLSWSTAAEAVSPAGPHCTQQRSMQCGHTKVPLVGLVWHVDQDISLTTLQTAVLSHIQQMMVARRCTCGSSPAASNSCRMCPALG